MISQADNVTQARDVSSIMRQVQSRNTAPEIKFRQALREAGIGYRLKTDHLPGKPDLIVPRAGLAIFIDGDYWHGGQWVRRGLTCLEDQFRKSANAGYWLKKIRGNMRRDAEASAALLTGGWRVLRLWESDIKKDIHGCIAKVKDACELKSPVKLCESIIPYKKVAEFFAGIGLVRLGLEQSNWRIVYANDIDPKKHQMYGDQFGHGLEKFDLRDINKVRAGDIPDVTIATASFPCNDTSLAGARKGLNGEKSSALWSFVKLLNEMRYRRPPIVIVENVTGFLTSNAGKDIEAALVTLNDTGYMVDMFEVDASCFVPQSRKRLFIIGTLESLVSSDRPCASLTIGEGKLRPRRLADFIKKHPEMKWLVRQLPAPEKPVYELQNFLDDIPDDDPSWWNKSRSEYLLGQMNPDHRSRAETMVNGFEYSYGTVFRRVRKGVTRAELRWDGVVGCLRTPRGGSARQILFKGGKGRFRVRLLTARECARLMGAADYNIKVPESQALYGFGDAVAVPVMAWITTYYLDPLINQLLRGRVLGPLDNCGA